MWAIEHAYGSDMSKDRFRTLEDLIIESVRDNVIIVDGVDNQNEASWLESYVLLKTEFTYRRVSHIISYLDGNPLICQFIRNIFPQPVED